MLAMENNKASTSKLDVARVRSQFPQVLETKVHGKPLVYLDNAATTLKPKSVVDTIAHYYQYESANIHRGVHFLSEQGTNRYEECRSKIKNFINAKENAEVIFTRGTTESLNLVAQSYGTAFLKQGDEVLITEMEHHSNIVPWQMLCERVGAVLKVLPINDAGELQIKELDRYLTEKTKIVSLVYISNSLGTINPVKDIIQKAHQKNAVVVVDAAQAIAHVPVDVQDLDCDFLAFSGHKMFGPTGIGVLYGKRDLLDSMPPVQGGGDMIDQVTFEKTTYNVLPHKFEAGTPMIAQGIGLTPAITFIEELGFDFIHEHETKILELATQKIQEIEGVRLIGTAKNKASVLAFVVNGAHPHDIGTLLDMQGVAIRTGHHCTQPLMDRFGVSATCRASFSVYNNEDDVEAFIVALKKVITML